MYCPGPHITSSITYPSTRSPREVSTTPGPLRMPSENRPMWRTQERCPWQQVIGQEKERVGALRREQSRGGSMRAAASPALQLASQGRSSLALEIFAGLPCWGDTMHGTCSVQLGPHRDGHKLKPDALSRC